MASDGQTIFNPSTLQNIVEDQNDKDEDDVEDQIQIERQVRVIFKAYSHSNSFINNIEYLNAVYFLNTKNILQIEERLGDMDGEELDLNEDDDDSITDPYPSRPDQFQHFDAQVF